MDSFTFITMTSKNNRNKNTADDIEYRLQIYLYC